MHSRADKKESIPTNLGNRKTIKIRVDDLEVDDLEVDGVEFFSSDIDSDATAEKAKEVLEAAAQDAYGSVQNNGFETYKHKVVKYKLTTAALNSANQELLTERQKKEVKTGNIIYFIKASHDDYYRALGKEPSGKFSNKSYWLMAYQYNGVCHIVPPSSGSNADGYQQRKAIKKSIEEIDGAENLDVKNEATIVAEDLTAQVKLIQYVPEAVLETKFSARLGKVLRIVQAPDFTQKYRPEYHKKIEASKAIILDIYQNNIGHLSAHASLNNLSEQDKITVLTLEHPSVETTSDHDTLNTPSVLDAVLKIKPALLQDFAASLTGNENKQKFAGIVFDKVKGMKVEEQKNIFEAYLTKISSHQEGLALLFHVDSKQGCFGFNTTLAKHIQSLVSGEHPSEKSLERVRNILQAYMEGDEKKLVKALKTDRHGNQDQNTKSYRLYLLAKLKCIEKEATQQNPSLISQVFTTFRQKGCFSKTSLVEHIRDMVNSNSDKKLKRAYSILKAYGSGGDETKLEEVLKTNVDGVKDKTTTSFKLFQAARSSYNAVPISEVSSQNYSDAVRF